MSDRSLELIILGSGTSTGVPVIGCRCAVCTSSLELNRRTRCSALVHWQGRSILLDASTDFRQQALREGLDRVDALLLTHTHADHVHGIDDLRVFTAGDTDAIPVYGAPTTLAALRQGFSYIFAGDPETGFVPRLETRETHGPFDLFGLEVQPVPLEHGTMVCQGYRFGPLAYLTDCSGIPAASWPLLEGIDTLILDGLRLRPHATHFNVAQAIAVAERLGARRTLLTHLSHEIDHERHGRSLPTGVEFAHDGQRIRVTLS